MPLEFVANNFSNTSFSYLLQSIPKRREDVKLIFPILFSTILCSNYCIQELQQGLLEGLLLHIFFINIVL